MLRKFGAHQQSAIAAAHDRAPLGRRIARLCYVFFFNDTATTEIYTLSLHDALPIFHSRHVRDVGQSFVAANAGAILADRKSTRLNSSHSQISYAVFCLKKKKKK